MDTNKIRSGLPSLIKESIAAHPGYPGFAAWCEKQLIHPYPIYFLIWQASREAVVVELPSEDTCRTSTSKEEAVQEAYNHALGECRSAIEAQGLKVAS